MKSAVADGDSAAVLCVDDELSVLAGLSRQLRRRFSISIASSGTEALDILERADEPFAVIVSDMMMPGMNGAEFLRRSREISPESIRVLLTGHSHADLAAQAVNEGAISRYLTKPCSTDAMVEVLGECIDTYRRFAAERDVLEQTLLGAVNALAQVLAIAAPSVFARVGRVSRTVSRLVAELGVPDGWAVEVAVPLSQLGAVTLPEELLQRWVTGTKLTRNEAEIVARVPTTSLAIIEPIPRLEPVAAIIAGAAGLSGWGHTVHPGSRILRVALELDVLECGGLSQAAAVAALRRQASGEQFEALDVLADHRPARIEELPLGELRVGMTVASDLFSDGGLFLVGRGTPVTATLIARLGNFCTIGSITSNVWVQVEST